MEFTFFFLRIFFLDLVYAGPLLVFLAGFVAAVGYVVGRIEGWATSDALYYAFVTATTVGYGDFRPTKKSSKALAVALAFVGLVFTGMVVAIALHSADYAYTQVYEASAFRGRAAG